MDILQGFVQFLKIPASCSLSLPPSLLCRRALLSREWEPFLNLVTLSVEPSQIQLRQEGQEFSARWGHYAALSSLKWACLSSLVSPGLFWRPKKGTEWGTVLCSTVLSWQTQTQAPLPAKTAWSWPQRNPQLSRCPIRPGSTPPHPLLPKGG